MYWSSVAFQYKLKVCCALHALLPRPNQGLHLLATWHPRNCAGAQTRDVSGVNQTCRTLGGVVFWPPSRCALRALRPRATHCMLRLLCDTQGLEHGWNARRLQRAPDLQCFGWWDTQRHNAPNSHPCIRTPRSQRNPKMGIMHTKGKVNGQ